MIKFDHLNLPVSDPESSRDWYCRNFGFSIEFSVPERRTYALQDDDGFTIFVYLADGDLAGVRPALTFQVDDVDASYAVLSAAGIPFDQPPARYFWGYGAGLLDPDGYRILLWDATSMREKGGAAAAG